MKRRTKFLPAIPDAPPVDTPFFSVRIKSMKTKTRLLILTGFLVVMLVTGFLLMGREISVTVDGKTSVIQTRALTVSQALRGMGVNLTSSDAVEPAANSWLAGVKTITVDRSRTVVIWMDPSGAKVSVSTPAKTPRQALAAVGVTPAEDDTVKINGSVISLDAELPAGKSLLLQYSPAQTIQLTFNGQSQTLRSTAATLGDALWQNGITLKGGDSLSVPFSQPLSGNMNVAAASAVPLTISVDGETLQTISAAATVGAALAANNISLQNLDYSAPSEDSPLPQDGKITVVRVKLVQLEEQKVTPYSVEYTTDTTMAAGASVVTRGGQNGISVSREIVRYENGVEASRETESELVLQEKINELVTKGPSAATTSSTQTPADGAVGTIDTPNGTLSYYYSTTVYATSYSPCRLGTGSCGGTTASGKTLTTGMIAVIRAWYNILKGYQIYVPGYGIGTVEDLGSGVSGKQWIDLGYSDADWVQWSRNVTVYFLTPKPSGFSGSLP